MSVKDFEELEEAIREEILAAIGDLSETAGTQLKDIQPTEPVIEAAALAAAQVIMAFERGYRLGG